MQAPFDYERKGKKVQHGTLAHVLEREEWENITCDMKTKVEKYATELSEFKSSTESKLEEIKSAISNLSTSWKFGLQSIENVVHMNHEDNRVFLDTKIQSLETKVEQVNTLSLYLTNKYCSILENYTNSSMVSTCFPA